MLGREISAKVVALKLKQCTLLQEKLNGIVDGMAVNIYIHLC